MARTSVGNMSHVSNSPEEANEQKNGKDKSKEGEEHLRTRQAHRRTSMPTRNTAKSKAGLYNIKVLQLKNATAEVMSTENTTYPA